MNTFTPLLLIIVVVLSPGCHRIGAPPSKTPFGEETGVDGPFNQVANAFLLDLRDGRVAEAYTRTSADYQKQVNIDQFKAILARHPYPSGAGTSSTGHLTTNDIDTRKYSVRENRNNGSIEFSFEVKHAGNEYSVIKFSLK